MRFSDIQFDAPNAVYLLFLVIPLGLFFWYAWFQRKKMLSILGDSEVLASILLPSSPLSFWNKAVAFCLAWVFLVLTLMGPKGNAHYPSGITPPKTKPGAEITLRKRPHEIVLLVDASASMQISDTRTGQRRLDNAKEIADEIIRHMQGDNAALYAFTSEPVRLSPSTSDYLFVRLMLRDININESGLPGTNLTNALVKIHERYLSTFSPKRRTVILISDGGDTSIEALAGDVKSKAIDKLAETVQDASTYNYRVFTIGVGSEKGGEVPGVNYQGKPVVSLLQKELLQKISDVGRGQFYLANQLSPLDIAKSLFQFLERFDKIAEPLNQQEVEGADAKASLIYDLYYQIPLGLALLCITYGMLFPEVERKKSGVEKRDEKFASA